MDILLILGHPGTLWASSLYIKMFLKATRAASPSSEESAVSPVLYMKVRWRKIIFFKQYVASDYNKINNEELISHMNDTREHLIIYWLMMSRLTSLSPPILSPLFKHRSELVLLKEMIFVHRINELSSHFALPSEASCSILCGNSVSLGETSAFPALCPFAYTGSAALSAPRKRSHRIPHRRGRREGSSPTAQADRGQQV